MRPVIEKAKKFVVPIFFLLIVLLSIASFVFPVPSVLVDFFQLHRIEGIFGLILAMTVSTVIAPVAILPLIPMIAPLLGPFTTGFASWIGWTIGSVIAFCIARYGGRPLLARFASLETIQNYERKIPQEAHFALIIAMRIVIPVDVLSYALGLFSSVSFWVYTSASSLGILWFSFAFAYIGYALDSGDTVLFLSYSVASAIIFLVASVYVYRITQRSQKKTK